MGLSPQGCGDRVGVATPSVPPVPLVSGAMALVVMHRAKRDGEFIADLDGGAPSLGKGQMMGMGRHPRADQAGTLSDKFQVVFVPQPQFCADRELAFVDPPTRGNAGWFKAEWGR